MDNDQKAAVKKIIEGLVLLAVGVFIIACAVR